MLVVTSIQLSKRMFSGLSAWIDEPRNMSKWIGTIWAAWHRVERGGNELPSIGGGLMSLKHWAVRFHWCSSLHCWLWQAPSLCSCKSFHPTLKCNRHAVASESSVYPGRQAHVLLWMLQVQAEVATQNASQLVKSKAPWHNCICSCFSGPLLSQPSGLAAFLLCLPHPPLLYNIVLELEQGEASGWLRWQIRKGKIFWYEHGS